MALDPLMLSRIQWAWVISWHILLPAFTVGLASYIAVLEGLAFFTGKQVWARLSAFWTPIFAVSFGMGVVSGIVMPFQMGTNWSRFSDSTANVLAPLLAYEGLTAFFLEASFLGVLLFGRKLVPAWVHFFAGLMVAAGTLFSTFWILSVNSWMQTPAGFRVTDGRFFPEDWMKVIFNPSFPYRYVHNVTAFYITTGFVVLGVGAWLLRRGRSRDEAALMVRMALNLLIVLVPVQMVVGDLHGANTGKYQPAKLAAIEGRYDTVHPEPLTLLGIPDDKTGTMHYAVEVPLLGSLLLTHSWDGGIKGLDQFPADQRPPVGPPFFAFRIMVGIAILMLFVAIAGQVLLRRRRLDRSVWFLRLCQWTAPLGFVAVIAGWTTTEVGRQPWTVYGLMRTAHSVTPSLTGFDVVLSLTLYVLVYLVMFPTGFAVMAGIVRRGVPTFDEAPRSRRAGRCHPTSCPRRARRSPPPENRPMWHALVPIWTVILGLGVFIYVSLDGFDLGVGILHGLAPPAQRETIMTSIGPFWDGNETWLILGGVGLLAAFPLAFAIIIPAVYFPILVMLLALVFRGVAFEFRFKHRHLRRFWDAAFCGGSLVATFAQGMVLGSFIQGFKVEGRLFVGSSFDFFTPFALLTGVALVFGYALLGAGWLVMKTEGPLQSWSRRAGRICLFGVSCCIVVVSLWTPLANAAIAQRWFIWPNALYLLPLPLCATAAAAYTWRALDRDGDMQAFVGAIALFVVSYLGIAVSLWPMIVPGHYTLWEAASSESTQAFLLVGTLVLLPVVLFYTGWSYWIFRGKVREGFGYH